MKLYASGPTEDNASLGSDTESLADDMTDKQLMEAGLEPMRASGVQPVLLEWQSVDAYLVGTAADNHIRLSCATVSPSHAVIKKGESMLLMQQP